MGKNVPSVAVIGSGYWGKHLVRNFHELGALHAICDKNPDTLTALQKQYPTVTVTPAVGDVLQDPGIDGVVVATPAETHARLTRDALAAGKHVMVEKPLALEVADGAALVKAAEDQDRILMVGHLLQYHPAFTRLRTLADAGELGRINYIYSNRLNLGKIRREENILWSFAPHDISMILALAGESPEQVIATGGCFLHPNIADVTTTHLDFPSGLKGHLFVSWLHPYKEQKLIVVGDRKMAVFDDTLPWDHKLSLYAHRIEWKDHLPVPDRANAEPVALDEQEPLRIECQAFLNAMLTGKPPRTGRDEGLAVLQVLDACQHSLSAGGMPVRLSIDRASPDSAGMDRGLRIHPTAVIDGDVSAIGDGTAIWHFSHVLDNVRMGRDCIIGQNAMIGPNVTIGNRCKIQNNVSVYRGVTLEDDVFCGPSMVFTNVINPRADRSKMAYARDTRVQRGATIGANATIICGVTVGRYAMVGAGAVVTRDVADHALMMGNPARPVGWVCECGERLDSDLKCPACNMAFAKNDTGLAAR